MKTAILVAIALSLNLSAIGQIEIRNDTLFVDSIPTAVYGFGEIASTGIEVNVKILSPVQMRAVKDKFEEMLKNDFNTKAYLPSKRYFFEYNFVSEVTDLNSIGKAGELIELSGRNFNAAIALSFIGSAGGTALIFRGFPLAGAAVSIGSGLIALIVQISGNNKLMQAGQQLKQYR